MWEEADPLLGLVLYIFLMIVIFILPTTIGLISGWVTIKFKKMWKTSIVVWSLILYSPIIFLLGIDFIQRALKNAWNTLYGYSWVHSLYIVAGMLPFAVLIWILGTLFLYNIRKKTERNVKNIEKMENIHVG